MPFKFLQRNMIPWLICWLSEPDRTEFRLPIMLIRSGSAKNLPFHIIFPATTLHSQLPQVPNPQLSEQTDTKGTQMARMISRDGSAGAEGAPQVASQPALQKLRRRVCQVSPNVAVSQLPANTWRGNNSQRRQRLEELLASHQETLLGSRPSYANQL